MIQFKFANFDGKWILCFYVIIIIPYRESWQQSKAGKKEEEESVQVI